MGRRGGNALLVALVALTVVGVGWLVLGPHHDPRTPSAVERTALTGHRGAPATRSWTPWPQALHDAQHSGASTSTGPLNGHVRWSRRLEGDVTPGPVVAQDGTIYAASNGGVLHALDPTTGDDRWTLDGDGSYGSDLSTSPAVLPDGTILWPGPDSTLLAVSSRGRVLWRLPLDQQVTSPAVTTRGDVVVGDLGGRLMVLRPSPHGPAVQWQVDLGAATYGSPVWAPDGNTVYQSLTTGVVAVRAGRVRFSFLGSQKDVNPGGVGIWTSILVDAQHSVYAGTRQGLVYGVDRTGRLLWQIETGSTVDSYPALTQDGALIIGVSDGRLLAIADE